MAKLKKPTPLLLRTSDDNVWKGHVRYILGPSVNDLESKHLSGAVAKTPSWHLVLHYNQEMLNNVAELMNEGNDASGGDSRPLPS